jgi:ubiquinone/menaquinone biosynthesis C-methylase UbiE
MKEQSKPAMMEQSKIDNYVSARGARAYRADYDNKLHRRISDRWERDIFAAFFREIGHSRTLLDLPCGAGRLFTLLRAHADAVLEADFSPSMLALNAGEHGRAAELYVQCSGLELPFADGAVDTVVSVRLNHHLNTQEHREQHVCEVLRVASRAAILTFFSFHSLKNLIRRIRAPFNRKAPKNAMRPSRLVELADARGFAVRRLVPLSRLSSGHVFALMLRR